MVCSQHNAVASKGGVKMNQDRERYCKSYRDLCGRQGQERIWGALNTIIASTTVDAVRAALWDENPHVEFEVSRANRLKNIKFRAKDLARIGEYLAYGARHDPTNKN
jgi:hypothetical protein